jgi:DNA-binding CsgD family transcriptional regulator
MADSADSPLFQWVLSESASKLYLDIVDRSDVLLDDLVAAGHAASVAELEAKGFVRTSVGTTSRVIPLPPEVPIVRNFKARTAEWLLTAPRVESVEHDLREVARRIGTRVALPGASAAESVHSQMRELPSRSERGFVATSMFTSAQTELLVVQSSKKLVPNEPENIEVAPIDLLERGVVMRFIYDASVLEDAEFLTAALDEVSLGADARVTEELPTDFVVADRRCAMVKTSFDPPNAMYTESTTMIDTYVSYFEVLWRQARPIGLRSWGEATMQLTEAHRLVLSLVVNGLNNEAIARTLHVHPRTVRRRIDDLSDAYSVTSRNALIAAAATG